MRRFVYADYRSTLLPGTYTIKIFYAFKQVFQEDFTMVGDSVLAVNYRIINREVFRDDSTTFTGGRVMPMSTGGDSTQQTIEPPTAGSSRKR